MTISTTNTTHDNDINTCKSILERAGFKRTTSRRYMRYEREAVDCFGDACIEGVELTKHEGYVEWTCYRTYDEFDITSAGLHKLMNEVANLLCDAKDLLKARFNELYPNCKLACIQLDGFTHGVFYIDENGKRAKDTYCAYMSEGEAKAYNCNSERVKALFSGYYHETYKHNPTEIVYMQPADFLSYPLR